MTDGIWICDDQPSERFPVWTRGNAGEVFVEVASPITWSLLGRKALEPAWREAFCHMGVFTPDEFKPAGQPEVCACFGGYVYINQSVTRVMAVRVPGLTVEAMDRSLFGDDPEVPPYRPDPHDANPARTAAAGAWLQSLFTGDPGGQVAQEGRALDAFLEHRPDLTARSDRELLVWLRSHAAMMGQLFRRHVLVTYGANVLVSVTGQLCQAAGASEQFARVTVTEAEVESASPTLALWTLSRSVRAAPSLMAQFDRGVEGLLERLRTSADPAAGALLREWQGFIAHWGFVGPSVWDYRSPTYASDPHLALGLLDRAREAPDTADPVRRAQALQAARTQAVEAVAARLAADPAARGQFLGAVQAASAHLTAREAAKTLCARLIDEGRRTLRELGGRLVSRGVLGRWQEVLMVLDEEFDDFLADPAAFGGPIAERAARFTLLQSKEPPFVFEGAPPPLSAFLDRAGAGASWPVARPGETLSGLGVSAGRHTGRARIVASLDAVAALQPGEVMVAVITDSSWGPLFMEAGAVVVETGAAISHAAIVARELGIPAVVSVAGATRRIREGATVTVDGSTGTVTVH
jgi:phosphohistidine swiveling domain-containing protein